MMLRSMAPIEGSQGPDYRPPMRRKRKAEAQDSNERLSKRLSLLNLERGGQKLYVPVENPKVASASPSATSRQAPPQAQPGGDSMQVDDSRHKVYIYNIDDELSSESEAEDGKLVFLPDIAKHLLANRIPPTILPNKDGELAGMQMVLYREPSSLTVPEEQDSVRKAIIESRARIRQRQKEEREGISNASVLSPLQSAQRKPDGGPDIVTTWRPYGLAHPWQAPVVEDPDAMEID